MRSRRSSSEGFAPNDSDARDFILAICSKLKEEDFAFTVNAAGTPWDVFRFTTPANQKGMVAYRMVDGRHEIGFFRKGEWTPADIEQYLNEGAPS